MELLAAPAARRAALVSLLLLAACGRDLPTEPAARVAVLRARIAEAPSGQRAGAWLAYVARDPSPEGRTLLLESLDSDRHMLASTAASILARKEWIGDPDIRARIAATYADPLRSLKLRRALRDLCIKPRSAEFPEFGNLPPEPVLPRGRAVIAP